MITDKDVEKILTAFLPVFATKEDLREFKEELKDEIQDLKSDVYTKMDAVHGEVIAMRQEQSILNNRQSELEEKVELHDTRIKKLERPQVVAEDIHR